MSCFPLVPVAIALTAGDCTKDEEEANAVEGAGNEDAIAKGGVALVEEELEVTIGGGLIRKREAPCEVGAVALTP